MQTKTGRDLSILEITKDNYIVPAGEEHVYHVRIEVKKFNQETGERQSQPRIQKFGATMYKTSIEKNLKKQGFTLDVLHDPSEWLTAQNNAMKANAKEIAKAKALAAESQAKVEEQLAQEKKAADKAALKAEIIEELRAAGIIPAKEEKKAADDTKKTEAKK